MDELTAEEVAMLKGLVRASIRKQDRNRAGLVRSFGDAADLSGPNGRTALLESIYRKLGGVPERISNRTHEDQG